MRRILIILASQEVQQALNQLQQMVGTEQAEAMLAARDVPPVIKQPDIVDEMLNRPAGYEHPKIKAIRRQMNRELARQRMISMNARRRK